MTTTQIVIPWRETFASRDSRGVNFGPQKFYVAVEQAKKDQRPTGDVSISVRVSLQKGLEGLTVSDANELIKALTDAIAVAKEWSNEPTD